MKKTAPFRLAPAGPFALLFPLLALLLVLALGGCSATGKDAWGGKGGTSFGSPDAAIGADLGALPQNPEVWLPANPAEQQRFLLTAEAWQVAVEKTRRAYFAPWQARNLGKLAPERVDELFWAVKGMNPAKGYMENLRPYDEKRWAALVENCDVEGFKSGPGQGLPAIALRNSMLRMMPAHTPFFLNPAEAGEGFPFDMYNVSAIYPGTPLRIAHRSQDRNWLLVEAPGLHGWLPAEDVAEVDEAFTRRWQRGPFIVLTQDQVTLRPLSGPEQTIYGPLGALLPVDKSAGNRALLPVRGLNGKARAVAVVLPDNAAGAWPLQPTPRSIASLGKALAGQPYGWGGAYEARDCSALTRDILFSIGILLPRNSRYQAAAGGPVKLDGLNGAEKERLLREQATPFLSLLGFPGHIGIYLGEYEGQAVMLHSYWGIRTLLEGGGGLGGEPVPCRAVLGKTIISTLRLGAERPDADSRYLLLERLRSFNFPQRNADFTDAE